eukprot:gene17954-biopygen36641
MFGTRAMIGKPCDRGWGSVVPLARFRVAGGVGREFRATNGILQGCPLSVALLNAAVSVWCAAVAAEVPEASPQAYADDQYVISSAQEPIRRALAITVSFGDLTGGKLNVAKCATFGTEPMDLRIGGVAVPHRTELRCVGAPVSGRRGRHPGVLEGRMRGVEKLAERIRSSQQPIESRAELAAALMLQRGVFGCSVHQ